MKILIAGLGSIGRRHFRNLIALGQTDLVLLRTRKATVQAWAVRCSAVPARAVCHYWQCLL